VEVAQWVSDVVDVGRRVLMDY